MAKTTVHPLFGNLQIETRPDSVALSLRLNHDGRAVFTYREITVLAGLLSKIVNPTAIRPEEPDEDDDDAMSLV